VDENLAHRIGLVPLVASADCLGPSPDFGDPAFSVDRAPPEQCFEFSLEVTGKGQDITVVYSKDLIWVPLPGQHDGILKGKPPPRPVHKDIPIAKLKPGQQIKLRAFAVKGYGRDHAKWSPVATAWYLMVPEVELVQEVYDREADDLVKVCPMHVFDIEDLGSEPTASSTSAEKSKSRRAIVKNERACTMCRECISNSRFTSSIALMRRKDHFIFTVESSGAMPAVDIFRQACQKFSERCVDVQKAIRSATIHESDVPDEDLNG